MHDEAQKGPLCSNSGSSLNVQFVYWKALNARPYGKWSLHVQSTKIVVEGCSVQEHSINVQYTGYIPKANISIEQYGTLKYMLHAFFDNSIHDCFISGLLKVACGELFPLGCIQLCPLMLICCS